MTSIEQAERTIWLDRFRTPTIRDLVRSYPSPVDDLAGSLVEALSARTGRKPTIEWRGVPWRWTGVFRRPSDAEPWAYFVPANEAPALAMPVSAHILVTDPGRSLSRVLREPIEKAPVVGQIRWAEWAVTTDSALTEIMGFVDRICEPNPD